MGHRNSICTYPKWGSYLFSQALLINIFEEFETNVEYLRWHWITLSQYPSVLKRFSFFTINEAIEDEALVTQLVTRSIEALSRFWKKLDIFSQNSTPSHHKPSLNPLLKQTTLLFLFFLCIEWRISEATIKLIFRPLPFMKLFWFYEIQCGRRGLRRSTIIFVTSL